MPGMLSRGWPEKIGKQQCSGELQRKIFCAWHALARAAGKDRQTAMQWRVAEKNIVYLVRSRV